MPYRKGVSKTWFTRVTTRDGRRLVCCTNTTLERTARDVEAWVRGVRDRLDTNGILDAIVDKRITLSRAFALQEEGVRQWLDEELRKQRDTDLTPLLKEWVAVKSAAARGSVSAADYERQIKALFPAVPFLKSALTVPRIAKALDALPVSDPTRNRYRAALSGFCRWLVRRGELDSNPAREAGGYAEREGRTVWYDRETAERVIKSVTDVSYRGREALMCGAGVDWSDVARLTVADINLKTLEVRCHGSKTKWRNRSIRITEAWTVPYIKAALANRLPDAPAFAGGNRTALTWHHDAVKAAKAQASTLHDWRHTYAVNALKNGQSATVVAFQLGHRDANLVWTRYGRFVPSAADYTQAPTASAASSATDLATSQHSATGSH